MTDLCDTATSARLNPPAVRWPRLLQGLAFAFLRDRAMRHWIKRYGRVFEIDVPVFGRSVVVSDPALVREVCTATGEQLGNVEPNLGNWFGPGSTFALDGSRHRIRRRLLTPALHGEALRNIESVIEEETLRECANWQQHSEFRTLEPMTRITLNVILRVIFGAESTDLDDLRTRVPKYLRRGELLAFLTAPSGPARRYSPWAKLDGFRVEWNDAVQKAITRAEADADLDTRVDLIAFLARVRRDDDSAIGITDVCDELLTLLCAGHETTAAGLAWTVERLRRHPAVLADLVYEADQGGSALRRATIVESMRVRTVIDVFGRRVASSQFVLGGWRIAGGSTVLVRVADLHRDPEVFTNPEQFDPYRFIGARAAQANWLPFGGGSRRCLGSAFAMAEMDVVLKTILRHFKIGTDAARDEKMTFGGVAHSPKLGARVEVQRRRRGLCPER